MRESSLWRVAAMTAVFAALATLPFLGSYGFLPEESRYAEIAREMAASGDWLRPKLNGVLYFEKPPALAWLGAALLQMAPVHPEWALRLVPALCSIAAAVAVAVFAARGYGSRTGIATGVFLTLAPLHLGFARVFSTDAPFSAAITIALVLLGFEWIQSRGTTLRLLAAGLALSFASLVRSPIAAFAIYGPSAVAAAWFSTPGVATGRFMAYIKKSLLYLCIPAAVCLFTAGPWFYLIQAREPAFFDQFFVLHHFGRVNAPEADKMLHREPVYFYLPVLLASASLVTLWLPLAISRVREFWRHPAGRAATLSAVSIFVLFTILSGKRAAYLLPVLPWTSMLLASVWNPAATNLRVSRELALTLAPTAVVAQGIAGVLILGAGANAALLPPLTLAFACVLLFLLFPLPCFLLWKGRAQAAALAGAGAACGVALFLAASIGRIGALGDATFSALNANVAFTTDEFAHREVCQSIKNRARNGDRIVQIGRFRHALNFYCNQRTEIFGSTGELAFGYKLQSGEPGIETPFKLKDLPAQLGLPPRILGLASWKTLFTETPKPGAVPQSIIREPFRGAPIFVLERHGDLIILSNRPDGD